MYNRPFRPPIPKFRSYSSILFERLQSQVEVEPGMGDMNGPPDFSISKERAEEYMADEPEPEAESRAEEELETSRLLELANSIQAQVSQIQQYLTKTKQPNPRFEADTPLTDWDGIDDTRSACLENLTQLQDLLMTPREILHTQAVSLLQIKRLQRRRVVLRCRTAHESRFETCYRPLQNPPPHPPGRLQIIRRPRLGDNVAGQNTPPLAETCHGPAHLLRTQPR
jgi:hypothetical protein